MSGTNRGQMTQRVMTLVMFMSDGEWHTRYDAAKHLGMTERSARRYLDCMSGMLDIEVKPGERTRLRWRTNHDLRALAMDRR